MATFQIPKNFIPGFAALAKLSESDFDKILLFAKNNDLGVGPQSFQDSFEIKFPEIDRTLAAVIYSFGNLLLRNNESEKNVLAKELADSYASIDNNMDLNLLRSRLFKLLQAGDTLKYTAKAINIMSENDHVYTGARILSDIRTIFNDKLDEEKHMAVIIHNLKLEFQQNNQTKEFFISLDNADLHALKEVVDRALEKENLLKNRMNNSLKFITINE